jgi:S1-C subfamily serine protease
MAPDDDADDLPMGRPLPPEDRLWRHPSEMAGADGAPREQILLIERTQPSMGRNLLIAALASLVGAGATIGIVLGTGVLVRERPGTTSHEVRGNGAEVPGADVLSVADRVLDSVVHLEATGPHGSVNATAVVFRSDGLLITTADAVDAAEHLTVVLPDSRRINSPEVAVVAKSISSDIAVLRIPADDLTPAAGSQGPVRRWAPAVVVDASPVTTGPSISEGVVTREVAEGPPTAGGDPMYGLIETTTRSTTAPLSPGTLFLDDAGTVIGLVTDRAQPVPAATAPTRASTRTTGHPTTRAATGAAAGTDAEGSGASTSGDGNVQHYAIPADHAWNVAAQLADTHQVVQPWVGLPTGEDLSVDEANREQIVGGMRVTRIETGSPAGDELQRDDIIVALESYNVTGYNAFVTALRRYKVGSYVTLRVLRKGAYENILLNVRGKAER